jgi:acyl dehydratase
VSDIRDVPQLGRGLTWEDLKPGHVFRTAARTITESDLIGFITAMGFTEALFFDARHAAEANYPGRLVPGALTYCIAEGLVLQTNVLQGTGIAFMHMELDVGRPVFVGDTLQVTVTTTESRASSRPGCGVVKSENRIFNQHGAEVAVYRPVRLIRGRDFVAGPAGPGKESR